MNSFDQSAHVHSIFGIFFTLKVLHILLWQSVLSVITVSGTSLQTFFLGGDIALLFRKIVLPAPNNLCWRIMVALADLFPTEVVKAILLLCVSSNMQHTPNTIIDNMLMMDTMSSGAFASSLNLNFLDVLTSFRTSELFVTCDCRILALIYMCSQMGLTSMC